MSAVLRAVFQMRTSSMRPANGAPLSSAAPIISGVSALLASLVRTLAVPRASGTATPSITMRIVPASRSITPATCCQVPGVMTPAAVWKNCSVPSPVDSSTEPSAFSHIE